VNVPEIHFLGVCESKVIIKVSIETVMSYCFFAGITIRGKEQEYKI
jgi:hypothetical protein